MWLQKTENKRGCKFTDRGLAVIIQRNWELYEMPINIDNTACTMTLGSVHRNSILYSGVLILILLSEKS